MVLPFSVGRINLFPPICWISHKSVTLRPVPHYDVPVIIKCRILTMLQLSDWTERRTEPRILRGALERLPVLYCQYERPVMLSGSGSSLPFQSGRSRNLSSLNSEKPIPLYAAPLSTRGPIKSEKKRFSLVIYGMSSYQKWLCESLACHHHAVRQPLLHWWQKCRA